MAKTNSVSSTTHPDFVEMFKAYENIFEPFVTLPESESLAVYSEALVEVDFSLLHHKLRVVRRPAHDLDDVWVSRARLKYVNFVTEGPPEELGLFSFACILAVHIFNVILVQALDDN